MNPDSAPAPPANFTRHVICLDGTWNNRDDCTNVFHLSTMVERDDAPEGAKGGAGPKIKQRVYYKEGVGTGILDGISGGAFGKGLSDNVRWAYERLVEKYREGDEIWITGFSRGAFTARSLVGFIAICGLLRRGAPMSVGQLWEIYASSGRSPTDPGNWWQYLTTGKKGRRLRPLYELTVKWKGRNYGNLTADDFEKNAKLLSEDNVEGFEDEPLDRTERMLLQWARPVRIKCLAIFDTVGSMGLDAFAMRGVHSISSGYHCMDLVPIIDHGLHAMAIDEHRANFPITAWSIRREGDGRKCEIAAWWDNLRAPEEQTEKKAAETTEAAGEAKTWQKIEQQWFCGAHSNIGGGYPDNLLTLHPLNWMAQRLKALGLKMEERVLDRLEKEDARLRRDWPLVRELVNLSEGVHTRPYLRDSWFEFGFVWTQIIRGKRTYRRVRPPARLQGGFILEPVGQEIDDSARAYLERCPGYAPPNFIEARKRHQEGPDKKPVHDWTGGAARKPVGKIAWWAMTFLWCIAAAAGIYGFDALLDLDIPKKYMAKVAVIVAFLMALADWAESRLNFSVTWDPESPWSPLRRALEDMCYWIRSIGVVLFAGGAGFGIYWLLTPDWSEAGSCPWCWAWNELMGSWYVPVAAAGGVLVALGFDLWRGGKAQFGQAIIGIVAGMALLLVLPGILTTAFVSVRELFGQHYGAPLADTVDPDPGRLIALGLLTLTLLHAMFWTGAPQREAGVGQITDLQHCTSPDAVEKCLTGWWQRVKGYGTIRQKTMKEVASPDECHITMKEVTALARESLWRDTCGFIPLALGTWLVAGWLLLDFTGWKWLETKWGPIQLWAVLPVAAAVLDWAESFFHFRVLNKAEAIVKGTSKAGGVAVRISLACTVLKAVAFFGCLGLGLLAAWHGCKNILDEPSGWRGLAAIVLSALSVVLWTIAVISIWRAGNTIRGPRKKKLSGKQSLPFHSQKTPVREL